MGAADYIILGILALLVVAVIYSLRRSRKKGSGCNGCSKCGHSCGCQEEEKKDSGNAGTEYR